MSEIEWSSEGEAPPRKKKSVPAWLWWGCGTGCLLMVLAAVVVTVLFMRVADSATDPEKVWPRVQELLPFDQRPEGWDADGGTLSFLGVGQFHLRPPGGLPYMILHRLPAPGEVDKFLDPESAQNRGVVAGVGKIREPQDGTIEIQGRETRFLRFRPWIPDEEVQQSISSIRIDITGTGAVPLLLEITDHSTEPVTDEEVRELLTPFDVWRGR